MKKAERQNHILNMIDLAGHAAVQEIMEKLGVSDMTVRRDLNELSQKGLLIRTHGGAQRIVGPEQGYERSSFEKKNLHEEEKKRIAIRASAYVREGDTVFLGPGTTVEQIAFQLRSRSIRVVTNSLSVFEILSTSTAVDLLLTGGEYRRITGAFVGSAGIRALAGMRFAKAFISANGIAGDAVYTYSEAEGDIQRTALNNSNEKFLAADSSKFNSYDFYEFCHVHDFDRIITDAGIDGETLHQLTLTGKVTIAE